jgi:hypothetical protein
MTLKMWKTLLSSSRALNMSREDRLDEALRTMDFYELAKITYEGDNSGNSKDNK